MSRPVTPAPSGTVRAWLGYSALRLGLFATCLLLGWVAGLNGFPLLLAALLVSGALAWFLLQRQRIALGAGVATWADRMRARAGARTAAEDAYVDQLQVPRAQTRDRDRDRDRTP